jgi:hypothetical protein
VWSPEFVVVEKGEPPRGSHSHSGIARRCDAPSLLVPHQLHTWVIQLRNRRYDWIRAVVHDDYFHRKSFLPERRAKGSRQQVPTVACGDDY